MSEEHQDNQEEIVIYQTPDGKAALEVRLQGDTVWLSQAQMAELFKNTKQNISLHSRNIFREGELQESAVVKESLTTAGDGKKYRTRYFNLDVIISVGYRVKSRRGTQFRIWATQLLREISRRVTASTNIGWLNKDWPSWSRRWTCWARP